MGGSISQRHGAQPVLSPHPPRKTCRHPRTGKRRRRSTRAASIAGRAKRAELLHQPHTPLLSDGRLRLRCPLRQGRPRRRGRVEPPPPSACTPLPFGPMAAFAASIFAALRLTGRLL